MEIETPRGGDVVRRKKERHRAVPLLPEFRYWDVAGGLEIREADKAGNVMQIVGQPIIYNQPYVVRDMFGEFAETMHPGVATEALAAGADVRLLLNHEGLPMARTQSGTLTFEDTPESLRCIARLDLRSQLSNDFLIAIERGDLNQMSVGFSVARDEWDDAMEQRDVFAFREFLDVSGVTYPASPATSLQVAQRMALEVPVESRARLRKLITAVGAGEKLSKEELRALRSITLDPGEDLETPEGTGPLGSPEGDGDTYADLGTAAGTPDGTQGAGSADSAAAGLQDGTGTRSDDPVAETTEDKQPKTSRTTLIRVKRAARGL